MTPPTSKEVEIAGVRADLRTVRQEIKDARPAAALSGDGLVSYSSTDRIELRKDEARLNWRLRTLLTGSSVGSVKL